LALEVHENWIDGGWASRGRDFVPAFMADPKSDRMCKDLHFLGGLDSQFDIK
jgi:hypothetical protein